MQAAKTSWPSANCWATLNPTPKEQILVLATGCQSQNSGAQALILKQLHKDRITHCLIWKIRPFTLAFGGFRINLNENMTKTRCFFTNITFKTHLCDSNHKKRRQKSSTIPSQRINGPSLLGKPFNVYLILKRTKPMKNFCHKTFRLTTSLASSVKPLQACNPQSALTPVRSVECGLFA